MLEQIKTDTESYSQLVPQAGVADRNSAQPSVTRQEASALLSRQFKVAANRFSRGAEDLRDDLLQEMFLAVLECKDANGTLAFYRRVGVSRAKNVLTWRRYRTQCKSLDDLKQEPAYSPPQEKELPLKYRQLIGEA